MKIECIEIAGVVSAYKALHLPFGKGLSGDTNKDNKLIAKLVHAGPEHAKVTRGIIYWLEITAPIYWWREIETYRAGRERLSCESTMHIDCKGLAGIELQKAKANITMGKEQKAIDFYSAQCLRNIYNQRKNHRLPEWKQFCEFIEALPYSKQFILC